MSSLIIQKQVPQPRSFLMSLDVHDNISSNTTADQTFRCILSHPLIAICDDKYSTRKRNLSDLVTNFHGTHKRNVRTVLCFNYFFDDKFLVNYESLQIHKHRYNHDEQFFKMLHPSFSLPFKVLNIRYSKKKSIIFPFNFMQK